MCSVHLHLLFPCGVCTAHIYLLVNTLEMFVNFDVSQIERAFAQTKAGSSSYMNYFDRFHIEMNFLKKIVDKVHACMTTVVLDCTC